MVLQLLLNKEERLLLLDPFRHSAESPTLRLKIFIKLRLSSSLLIALQEGLPSQDNVGPRLGERTHKMGLLELEEEDYLNNALV